MKENKIVKKNLSLRRAFTMLELIFVIVIVGILAKFGADIYTKVYMNYSHSRAINTLESRTEQVLEVMASKLKNRIARSTVAIKSDKGKISGGSPIRPIYTITGEEDILEWYGSGEEIKIVAGNPPKLGWSGFVDLNSTDTKYNVALSSPGSDINNAQSYIASLYPGSEKSLALVFDSGFRSGIDKIAEDYSWLGNQTHKEVMVGHFQGKNFNLDEKTGSPNAYDNLYKRIWEEYNIAFTAYAIVPEDVDKFIGQSKMFNLYFYFNYQPWKNGSTFDKGKKSLLADNVSLFRFREENGVLYLKICMRDANKNFDSKKLDVIACKVKAV